MGLEFTRKKLKDTKFGMFFTKKSKNNNVGEDGKVETKENTNNSSKPSITSAAEEIRSLKGISPSGIMMSSNKNYGEENPKTDDKNETMSDERKEDRVLSSPNKRVSSQKSKYISFNEMTPSQKAEYRVGQKSGDSFSVNGIGNYKAQNLKSIGNYKAQNLKSIDSYKAQNLKSIDSVEKKNTGTTEKEKTNTVQNKRNIEFKNSKGEITKGVLHSNNRAFKTDKNGAITKGTYDPKTKNVNWDKKPIKKNTYGDDTYLDETIDTGFRILGSVGGAALAGGSTFGLGSIAGGIAGDYAGKQGADWLNKKLGLRREDDKSEEGYSLGEAAFNGIAGPVGGKVLKGTVNIGGKVLKKVAPSIVKFSKNEASKIANAPIGKIFSKGSDLGKKAYSKSSELSEKAYNKSSDLGKKAYSKASELSKKVYNESSDLGKKAYSKASELSKKVYNEFKNPIINKNQTYSPRKGYSKFKNPIKEQLPIINTNQTNSFKKIYQIPEKAESLKNNFPVLYKKPIKKQLSITSSPKKIYQIPEKAESLKNNLPVLYKKPDVKLKPIILDNSGKPARRNGKLI